MNVADDLQNARPSLVYPDISFLFSFIPPNSVTEVSKKISVKPGSPCRGATLPKLDYVLVPKIKTKVRGWPQPKQEKNGGGGQLRFLATAALPALQNFKIVTLKSLLFIAILFF